MAALERQHFWGCTLTKEKPEVKWLGAKEVDIGEVDVLNQLVLSQACLGLKAKDNVSHIVQVTTTGMNSNTITQPIVVLSSGIRQVQCRLEFSAAATFKLIEGNGPIHLSGSHVQVLSDHEFEESEGENEDQGIASGKQSPVQGNTKPSPPSKQPPAKRPKLEPENDVSEGEGSSDDEEDDDEPDELVPIKEDKAKKKPAVETKKLPQKSASPSSDKKAKSNLLDKKAEEEIEESEDEMEESDDNDDDDDDDEKDEDFDEDDIAEEEGDDDDDDDDESDKDEDGDESDEEESEGEDEIVNAILAKNKLRGQVNGKKTPDKKTPDRRTPQKKTPDNRTPKKTSVEASVNLEKTPDITTIKQKLLKSPNLPKKMDKFRNFMKTNMRITDEKVVKELWGWLQQNKK